jgi:hypothetical protein
MCNLFRSVVLGQLKWNPEIVPQKRNVFLTHEVVCRWNKGKYHGIMCESQENPIRNQSRAIAEQFAIWVAHKLWKSSIFASTTLPSDWSSTFGFFQGSIVTIRPYNHRNNPSVDGEKIDFNHEERSSWTTFSRLSISWQDLVAVNGRVLKS